MKITIDTSQWKILSYLKKYFKRWWRFFVWGVIVGICFETLKIDTCWQYWTLIISGGMLGILPDLKRD